MDKVAVKYVSTKPGLLRLSKYIIQNVYVCLFQKEKGGKIKKEKMDFTQFILEL